MAQGASPWSGRASLRSLFAPRGTRIRQLPRIGARSHRRRRSSRRRRVEGEGRWAGATHHHDAGRLAGHDVARRLACRPTARVVRHVARRHLVARTDRCQRSVAHLHGQLARHRLRQHSRRAAVSRDPCDGRRRCCSAVRDSRSSSCCSAAFRSPDSWRSSPRALWSRRNGCGSGSPPPTRCCPSRPVRSRVDGSAPRWHSRFCPLVLSLAIRALVAAAL